MDNEIQLFHSDQFGDVRALSVDGEPWFVAKDVCDALGIRTDTVRKILDSDEVSETNPNTIGVAGGHNPLVISEPGLYKLVLKSRKTEAKAFQRWVTHEVLPAIRRTGGYMVARDETPEQTMARALLIAQETIDRSNKALRFEQERNAALLEENGKLVPKAQFYDNLMDSDGLLSVRDAAKILKSYDQTMSEKRLRQSLRDDRMVEKRTTKACAVAIERGYMRERPFSIKHSDGHETFDHYGCLTPKGLDWCRRRYCDQHMFDFQ